MIFLSLSFIGIIAIFRLPLEVMPDTDLNTITILINIRGGMPPLEVESKVTRLVEEAVGGVFNLEEMFSLSKEGQAMVILNFQPGYKMDRASLEVRERMAHLKNEFPVEAERPIIGRFSYSDMPVFILGVVGRDPLDKVRGLVEKKIKNRFLNLEGVANVELAGGERNRVILELDQGNLVSLGLDIRSVLDSLRNDNFNLPAGEVRLEEREINLRTVGQYSNLTEMKEANLYYQGQDRLIKLAEIGTLKEGGLERTSLARLNGEEVVSIYIQKERSANTLAVTKNIKKELNKIKKEWLGQIKFIMVSDQGRFIEEAFSQLRGAMIIGIVLAVVILSLFLKDRRAIGAVILVMPISILATLFMLFICHLSLNIFTLSALALGVGMLVDNALVIVENISRYRGRFSEREALVSGGGQMGLAISSSTLTNVIVFLPLAFLRGETEMIFRSVGLTISFSLVFSLLAALTIVPLVMKRRRGIAAGIDERKWRRRENGYERLLISILRRRNFIVPFVFITAIVIFIPFSRLGRDIVTPQDENRLVIHAELPSGAKLSETDRVVREVEGYLRGVDEIETISTQIENWSGKIFLTLRPVRERRKRAEDIIAMLRPEIDKVKGAFIYFEEPESLGNQEVAIDVFGYDYEGLKRLAMEMARSLAEIDGLEDIKIKMREGRPEIMVDLWPGHLSSYGLTAREVAESLHAQLRGLRATYLHRQGEEIETVVRLKKEDRDTLAKIKNLNLYGYDRTPVSLKQISDLRFSLSPSEIWHKDKKRMISLSARRTSRLSLSKAHQEIEARIKKIALPPNYFYNYNRQFYDLKRMHREFIFLLSLTAILVYMVLASFFESYLKPFIIILMIPLAFSGVALFQVLRRGNINLGVLMGLVMLGGMAVNSAILYVDRIRTLSYGRKSQMRIVIRAASERLRPILMTSLSTIFGLMPLTIFSRTAASLWVELARTIMIGLIFSLFFSLLIIPAILSFFEGGHLLGRRLEYNPGN